jgi:hypothetical protein
MAGSGGLGAVLGWKCAELADITGTAWVWFLAEIFSLLFCKSL